MKRISSKNTFLRKRVVPVIWFGFLVLFVILTCLFEPKAGQSRLPFFVVPIVLAVFGYVMMRLLVFDLADEVYDLGDELLVRNNRKELHIAFFNITRVNFIAFTNPSRITLELNIDTVFGRRIVFEPSQANLFSLRRNEIADAIRQRSIAAVNKASGHPHELPLGCDAKEQ